MRGCLYFSPGEGQAEVSWRLVRDLGHGDLAISLAAHGREFSGCGAHSSCNKIIGSGRRGRRNFYRKAAPCLPPEDIRERYCS